MTIEQKQIESGHAFTQQDGPSMRILVIEDSTRMAQTLKRGLSEECYAVDVEGDGIAGLHLAQGGEYDLILLDVNLPGMDGFTLLRKLRALRSDVPVLLLTARDKTSDRVEGLDCGADDYLVKPFAFEELLARVRALLRRPGARTEPILRFEDIELDPALGKASRNGVSMALSAREFALLRVFLANSRRILSRAKLYEAVWNSEYDGLSNVLDVYVNYLRNKLEAEGGKRVIHAVRGRGYILGEEA
jgi:DNA-binding response OmpR family regulator